MPESHVKTVLKNRKPHTKPAYLAMTTSAVDGVGTIAPKARTGLKQRQRQSPSAAARQDRAPSEQPRQSCASAKWWRVMPRLRLGKLTEEALCLGRPTTSSFASHYDEPCMTTSQLGIHQLFPSACTPTHDLATRLWRPRFSGATRVVSRASCAPWNNGNPSATTSKRGASTPSCGTRSKSLTITFVVTRAPASRQTRAAAFPKRMPRNSTPRLSASCLVVAKKAEKTPTPTDARRWGEGLARHVAGGGRETEKSQTATAVSWEST